MPKKCFDFLCIILLNIIFCFSICHSINPALKTSVEIGKIAAVINDHIISTLELNDRIKLELLFSNRQDTSQNRQAIQEKVLSDLINETLKLLTTEKYNIKSEQSEVQASFDLLENRNGMEPGQLKKILHQYNIPLSTIYRRIQAELEWQNYIQARYRDLIQITDSDIEFSIKQFEIKKDKPQFFISEILITDDLTKNEKAFQRTENFVQELKNGAQFSVLAEQFSQSASAARGGDIGWVTLDQLDDLLAKAVVTLKPGQISSPIQTEKGYYILLLKDSRAAGESIGKDTLLTFNQVLFPVSQPFTDQKLHPIFSKAKTIISYAKSCDSLKSLTNIKDIQWREIKKMSIHDMVPQIKNILLSLNLNKPSDLILTDIGFLVFMVCEKEDLNPDNPSHADIRNFLIREKLAQHSKRELRNIFKAAHKDIFIKFK